MSNHDTEILDWLDGNPSRLPAIVRRLSVSPDEGTRGAALALMREESEQAQRLHDELVASAVSKIGEAIRDRYPKCGKPLECGGSCGLIADHGCECECPGDTPGKPGTCPS